MATMEREKKQKMKRKSYTIQEKIEWIEEASKPDMSQVTVTQEFGITPSTLDGAVVKGASKKAKRLSQGLVKELEDKLYEWFLKKWGKGLPMDKPLLRKQAETLADKMGLTGKLTFSAGWLWRWRCRYGVIFKNQRGEQQDADFAAAEKWQKEVLSGLLNVYSPDDVFDSDETELFYRGLANHGFVTAPERAKGVKGPKDRVAVLVTANMSGTAKPCLLGIGKSARPRGFHRDLSHHRVHYESSKKAWMTEQLWLKFLFKLGLSLHSHNRRILLPVDHVSSHPQGPDLTNNQMGFMPKNTTSLIQPCDAGTIKNLKGTKVHEFFDFR